MEFVVPVEYEYTSVLTPLTRQQLDALAIPTTDIRLVYPIKPGISDEEFNNNISRAQEMCSLTASVENKTIVGDHVYQILDYDVERYPLGVIYAHAVVE